MSKPSEYKFPSYSELENMKGSEIYTKIKNFLRYFHGETGSEARVIYIPANLYMIFAINKVGDKFEDEIIVNHLRNIGISPVGDTGLTNTICLSNRHHTIEYGF